jgi:hypothetical protein
MILIVCTIWVRMLYQLIWAFLLFWIGRQPKIMISVTFIRCWVMQEFARCIWSNTTVKACIIPCSTCNLWRFLLGMHHGYMNSVGKGIILPWLPCTISTPITKTWSKHTTVQAGDDATLLQQPSLQNDKLSVDSEQSLINNTLSGFTYHRQSSLYMRPWDQYNYVQNLRRKNT